MKYLIILIVIAVSGRALKRVRWLQTELMHAIMLCLCLALALAAFVTMPGDVP